MVNRVHDSYTDAYQCAQDVFQIRVNRGEDPEAVRQDMTNIARSCYMNTMAAVMDAKNGISRPSATATNIMARYPVMTWPEDN